jgi:hypothetical protein
MAIRSNKISSVVATRIIHQVAAAAAKCQSLITLSLRISDQKRMMNLRLIVTLTCLILKLKLNMIKNLETAVEVSHSIKAMAA